MQTGANHHRTSRWRVHVLWTNHSVTYQTQWLPSLSTVFVQWWVIYANFNLINIFFRAIHFLFKSFYLLIMCQKWWKGILRESFFSSLLVKPSKSRAKWLFGDIDSFLNISKRVQLQMNAWTVSKFIVRGFTCCIDVVIRCLVNILKCLVSVAYISDWKRFRTMRNDVFNVLQLGLTDFR